MMRLLKYLKPYWWMVVLAIVLLFGQANFDLALPDYLSRIVNVGIQQGGVENAVPEAMRQSQMEKLLLFMSPSEKDVVLSVYTLADESAANYGQLVNRYPILEKEPVYVLDDIDDDTIKSLNPVMAKAMSSVSAIQMMVSNPEMAAEMGFGNAARFDLTNIPAGMDVFALLAQIPAEQLDLISSAATDRFQALGENMMLQSATSAVRAEYEALGMNTERLQTRYLLGVGGMMLVLTLLSGACIVSVGYLSALTAAGLARDLRRAVFAKVESFSLTEINTFSTASLITRTTNDITQVQMVVVMLRIIFYAPITGIGGVIRAIGKGGSMWWLIAVAVGALISVILVLMSIAIPKFKSIQKLVDRINLVAREHLSGMLVIRAFNRQDDELARFDQANVNLTNVMRFINRLMVIMMPFMMLIMNGLSLAILW
ncbi:MAG: ABC transporter permease, partial [Anaerolineae bacterium]|nr:ABC transporter permease [Anaerolineae bacterium]